jgi:hypothetical protein
MHKNTDYTIRGISEEVNSGEKFGLAFGDFLDSFYRATDEERVGMIAEPPSDMHRRDYVPFLAATAHRLANNYKLKPPDWAFEERCYLPGADPYFQFDHRELRAICMYVSPPEFKHRNIFVLDTALSRA